MGTLRMLAARVLGLWHRTPAERELAEELAAHRALLMEDGVRRGLSPEEALRQANLALGSDVAIRETVHDQAGIPLLESVGQDVRYGLRMMAKSPVLTAIAVLTLALGIGANTATFSLLDTALLQRLAVRHPEQLRTVAVIWRSGDTMSNVPAEFFEQLRQSPRSFSGVFAFWRTKMNFDTGGDVERTLVQFVSGGYYPTLGVSNFLGRTIDDVDEKNREHVAVLSHSFWSRRFGADPAIVGKTFNLNGVPTTIIGITPPGFSGTDPGVSPDVTIPLQNPVQFSNLWVTVRLKPEVSEKQALAEAEIALQRALESMRPSLGKYRAADREGILSQRAALLPGDKGLGQALHGYTAPLRVLMLLSAVVLLIACVNIANLLLARSTARSREFGVRLALGAARRRLVRQLTTETALLWIAGAVAGVALAFWMQRALVWLLMDDAAAQAVEFSLNAHVIAFSAAAALVTLLLCGLAPALRATRVDTWSLLKREARRDRNSRLGAAKSLIVGQVAASMLLLFSAGLLVRTFRNLSSLDTGVPLDSMLVMRIGASPREYQRPPLRTGLYQELVSRTEAVPGVVSAALAWDFAFATGTAGKSVWVEGQPAERAQSAAFNVVGPGFFATAGIPVKLGREFSRNDILGAPKVVMINEAFARRYFPGQNPVGRYVGDDGANSVHKYQVVGVVQDSRTMFLRQAPGATLYQPLLQDEWASNVLLHVRTRGSQGLIRDRVRAEIRAIDSKLPVYDVTTLRERLSLALRQDRIMATLAAFFGMLALLLTAIGVFGVIAYAVARRTNEIGIRMALGAGRDAVLRMVLRESLLLVVAGVALGVPGALLAGHLLRGMLYGIGEADPFALLTAALLLIGAAAVAAFLPARRAARVDPMVALRCD